MKIAITAASGQLGAAIIKATVALSPGDEVIGLARSPEKAKHLGVEIRPGDYNNLKALTASLQSVDTLLLMSGMDAPAERLIQHRQVIQAAQLCGVKRIVYTSVQGAEEHNDFSPIVQSNRQTEADVRQSGLNWVIGRNGIYIEPDIDYLDRYKKAGHIANCAGTGKCGYTTRDELAYAYAKMLLEDQHHGQTYNLHGEAISQTELVEYINRAFGTTLSYTSMSVDQYRQERIAELGAFIGTVIAGIYQGIHDGKMDNPSHYHKAAGRPHQSWSAYFKRVGVHRSSRVG